MKSQTKKHCKYSSFDNEEHETAGSGITLSGLLNFTDGLWSCCGEERIIVFTTNHKDNVDPALLRCGRMDVHINLGVCGVHAFKSLVRNYLGLGTHSLFDVVERCLRSGGALTPAQVGEILLRNRGNADVAMQEVVRAMHGKILSGKGSSGSRRQDQYSLEYDDALTKSPRSVLTALLRSPENSDSSPGRNISCGMKRKGGCNSLDKKAKFLVRLRSLTKSDSGRR